MDLSFETITESDIPELTRVMTRAFDDDAQRHLGQEKGGPPGYDDGGFFQEWLFPYEESKGYKVLLDGRIVGGLIVWILEDGDNILGTIFVDPDYQNRGIGTRTWEFVEATYPDTKSWKLHTPSYATSNHHFYEKCGFVKVGEQPEEGYDWASYIYRKEMGGGG
jgi:GNAT superfamily N-acetyltransferase